MLIIGCDFHTRYQQIAMMDQATGELVERRRVADPPREEMVLGGAPFVALIM